jgi:hypothetical protein
VEKRNERLRKGGRRKLERKDNREGKTVRRRAQILGGREKKTEQEITLGNLRIMYNSDRSPECHLTSAAWIYLFVIYLTTPFQ